MFPSRLLAQRMELAQAEASAAWAKAHHQRKLESDVALLSIGGGYAIFAGVDSPLTQVLGMGLREDITEDHLIKLESFYGEKSAPVNIELAPFFDQGLLKLFGTKHYHLIELSNVLLYPLSRASTISTPTAGNITVRPITSAEVEIWAKTMAQGFMDISEFADIANIAGMAAMSDMVATNYEIAPDWCFGAFIDEEIVGGGNLFIYEGMALLSGASTLPAFRRRGVQTALIHSRLHLAQMAGCDFATTATLPGSISQHSMERHGFQSCYTRIKLCKER